MAAEKARTAAVLVACSQICADQRLLTHPSENDDRRSTSCGEMLVTTSHLCPAARHGVFVWVSWCVNDKMWFSANLDSFFPILLELVKVYSTYPRSQGQAFDILKSVLCGPLSSGLSQSQGCDLNRAQNAAVCALANLATIWDRAPEVFDFVNSISVSQIKSFLVHLSLKALPPFSQAFATAAATLFLCEKSKYIFLLDINSWAYEEQSATYAFLDGVIRGLSFVRNSVGVRSIAQTAA